MFTLKLYRNGPLPPSGHTVILETVGLWINECESGMKRLLAFKKKVGVEDEDGTPEYYVGGSPGDAPPKDRDSNLPSAVVYRGDSHYYDWGVLENAQGKTTQVFR